MLQSISFRVRQGPREALSQAPATHIFQGARVPLEVLSSSGSILDDGIPIFYARAVIIFGREANSERQLEIISYGIDRAEASRKLSLRLRDTMQVLLFAGQESRDMRELSIAIGAK